MLLGYDSFLFLSCSLSLALVLIFFSGAYGLLSPFLDWVSFLLFLSLAWFSLVSGFGFSLVSLVFSFISSLSYGTLSFELNRSDDGLPQSITNSPLLCQITQSFNSTRSEKPTRLQYLHIFHWSLPSISISCKSSFNSITHFYRFLTHTVDVWLWPITCLYLFTRSLPPIDLRYSLDLWYNSTRRSPVISSPINHLHLSPVNFTQWSIP